MLDLLYVLGTVLFFILMLLYARACASLGRRHRDAGGELSEVDGAISGTIAPRLRSERAQ